MSPCSGDHNHEHSVAAGGAGLAAAMHIEGVMRPFCAVLVLWLSFCGAAWGEETSFLVSPVDLSPSLRLRMTGLCANSSIFYERRGWQPAWNESDGRAMMAAIEHAGDDGLRPATYHLAELQQPERDPLRYDALLTDAFLVLASHLAGGVVDPHSIEPTWCLASRRIDVVVTLENALAEHNVRETLQGLAPQHPGYQRLRQELLRLRAVQACGGWAPVERHDLPSLVERLRATDDLIGIDISTSVCRFQQLHGLTDDCIVGPKTLRELNVPVEVRIRQIEANMERWRWLPSSLGSRYVLINIPEFRLRVIDQGEEVLSMRIVVGKNYQQTPVFSAEILQIVFSPYWNVPDSIAARELWPKARRDRGFLTREHMQVIAGHRLRQLPGPWNSLGRIKFNMPNRYDVYLHDTPARSLFNESVRAFSHGCMRVEKPVDLAQYLLGWARSDIVRESERDIQRFVDVNPLPVHVLYWTAFTDSNGELHFAPDVYGRDAVLVERMGL